MLAINNLTETVEQMKNFENKEELISLLWQDVNLKQAYKKHFQTISSDHCYYNFQHTIKVKLKDAEGARISFSEASKMQPGYHMKISSDPEATKDIILLNENLSQEKVKFSSNGTFYIHFPIKNPSDELVVFGENSSKKLITSEDNIIRMMIYEKLSG